MQLTDLPAACLYRIVNHPALASRDHACAACACRQFRRLVDFRRVDFCERRPMAGRVLLGLATRGGECERIDGAAQVTPADVVAVAEGAPERFRRLVGVRLRRQSASDDVALLALLALLPTVTVFLCDQCADPAVALLAHPRVDLAEAHVFLRLGKPDAVARLDALGSRALSILSLLTSGGRDLDCVAIERAFERARFVVDDLLVSDSLCRGKEARLGAALGRRSNNAVSLFDDGQLTANVAASLASLRELNVYNGVGTRVLAALAVSPPRLQRLCMSSCTLMSLVALPDLVPACRHVAELEIADDDEWAMARDPTSVRRLAAFLSSLPRPFCITVTDALPRFLNLLLSSCRVGAPSVDRFSFDLRSFDFSSLSRVAAQIARCFPALRRIDAMGGEARLNAFENAVKRSAWPRDAPALVKRILR